MSGRTIVIGDIHGCFDELSDLLERVGLEADDRVAAVGDLVVKGSQNREVLELFMSDARFSSVLGNHDRALLRHWQGFGVALKEEQEKTRVELQGEHERYAAYLERLPLMIDLGSHLVVHAGVRPDVPLDEQTAEDLTELRTLGTDRTSREGTPWYEVYRGEKAVLFGHWPAREPRRAPHAVGLDTGCVYGHRLTACVIETGEVLSVPARRVYVQPKQPLR
jgi:diadenosine tetraphosphatase ApaH/serine/threonine PP2A family protein phosphatase